MLLRSLALVLVLVCASTFLAIFTSSCNLGHENISEQVYYIYIEKEQFPPEKLPIFTEPNPHPEGIIRTFFTGENIILDIGFKGIKKPITFSRFALVNLDISNSSETPLSGNLGPFGPFTNDGLSQIKEGPWLIPDQSGIYELRVYVGDNVVASAKFQVKPKL